jgi:hypothetical protein
MKHSVSVATTRQFFFNRLALLRYQQGYRSIGAMEKIAMAHSDLAYRFLNDESLTDHEKILLCEQSGYLLALTEDHVLKMYLTDLITSLAIKEGIL